ncbi:MAG: ATP-binding cassette domain-containing protein, partial [Candidatus Eremiobacteraeota bacterium]|nr:ATP-binding cassette domain-containing protein [Candidatus Eremiobacteraeota bacterium]
MIELQQVCKVFHAPDGREVHAVKSVSLTIEEGETICLIGTSGSGKTTTMKMINRLITPTSGKILVG